MRVVRAPSSGDDAADSTMRRVSPAAGRVTWATRPCRSSASGAYRWRCACAGPGPTPRQGTGSGQPETGATGRANVGLPDQNGPSGSSQRDPNVAEDMMSYGSPYSGFNSNGGFWSQSLPL